METSTVAGLPEGVELAPGELVAATGEFRVSNILFFIHWRMAVTNRRLIGRTPNTILGIIPLGSNHVSYPLANIAGVVTRRAYSLLSLIVGLFFLLAGLGGLNTSASGGIILIVLGLLILVSTIRASIQVTNSGGQKIAHGIAFTDRSAAQGFVNTVNTTIATYAHQGGGPSTDAPAVSRSASDQLDELQRLRDQGHLTPDEYETKRKQIIERM
jgi:Short C-terminal domain